MSDDIFIKHDKNGGTFQQPFLARVPAAGQQPNIAQRIYQVTTQGTQPFTYQSRTPTNVQTPSNAQNPIIAQGVAQKTYNHRSPAIYTSRAPSIYNIQTPSTYQHGSPLTYQHRSPFTYQLNYQHREPSTYQHRSPLIYRTPTQTRTPSIYTNRQPLTYEHRSPFTYDHRSPSTYNHQSPSRTPSTYQNREPLIYDHRSPYRSPFTYQHRSPFTYDHRSPSTYDNREPSIYQHRSPDTYDHRSPLIYQHQSPFRSPSIYQHQSPSTYQHQSPFRSPSIYQHQSPSTYQHSSPFRSPSIYQHQSPSIYQHRSPFTTPIIVNTQNSRNARTPFIFSELQPQNIGTTTAPYTEVHCEVSVSDHSGLEPWIVLYCVESSNDVNVYVYASSDGIPPGQNADAYLEETNTGGTQNGQQQSINANSAILLYKIDDAGTNYSVARSTSTHGTFNEGTLSGNISTGTAITSTSWSFGTTNGTFTKWKCDNASGGDVKEYETTNTFTFTSPDANMGTHTISLKVTLYYENEEPEDDENDDNNQE